MDRMKNFFPETTPVFFVIYKKKKKKKKRTATKLLKLFKKVLPLCYQIHVIKFNETICECNGISCFWSVKNCMLWWLLKLEWLNITIF